MSLESIFRLSLIMNMVDNLTGPMAGVTSSVGGAISGMQGLQQTFGGMVKTGAAMTAIGSQITDAVLDPVKATYGTQRALGELASLGVEDLGAIEDAARSFSSTWAGTAKADFITAAYDIKSGISTLSDEGISDFTALSGMTAKATKSTIAEMTSLFATGYNIYKGYYSDLTDLQFGEMFSAGIADSVRRFKTTGSGMAQAIQMLGASATNAQVPLEEQLSVLGMLQATMGGSEAGTKYKAFLRSATKGGEALGLSFVDANNQLLSMPEILDVLRGRFGDVMDAAEKMELQKAFGDTEAVALIDLMYNKVGDLKGNISGLSGALAEGTDVTQRMAEAINSTDPDQLAITQQHIQNLKESIGSSLLPTINTILDKADTVASKVTDWAGENQGLVGTIMSVVLILGLLLTVGGGALALIGGMGMFVSAGVGYLHMFAGAIGVAAGAFPALISSVWAFTSALLANPITWIVVGILALIAALIALYYNWDAVVSWARSTWDRFVNYFSGFGTRLVGHIRDGIQKVKDFFAGVIPWFKESGRKVITTFAEGIVETFLAPYNAIKNGLAKIRRLLPFSDAKEGPLSALTLSGTKVMTTFAEGMEQEQNLPAEIAEKGLDKVDLQLAHKPVQKVNLQQQTQQEQADERGGRYNDAKTTIIQKLYMRVDFKNIRELPKLIALLQEVEDYVQSNGYDLVEEGDF